MQYELKDFTYMGSPKQGTTAFTQTVMVVTGIVGQTYDGFCNRDMTKIDFPATGLDANEIVALVASAVTQFVATKYPNT